MAITPLHHLGLVGGPIGLEECLEHAVPAPEASLSLGNPGHVQKQPLSSLGCCDCIREQWVSPDTSGVRWQPASFFLSFFFPLIFIWDIALGPGDTSGSMLHCPTVQQLLGTHQDQAITKGLQKAMMWLQRSSPTVPS